MEREQRILFFQHLSESLDCLQNEQAEEVLDRVEKAMGSVIEDRGWALQMVSRQMAIHSKKKNKASSNTEASKQQMEATHDSDAALEPPEALGDEVLVESPAMREMGCFLFQTISPPYRRRLVLKDYSIIY